jgi:hypothetical protein
VTYAQGDLFALPDTWHQTFDLIHECYTLQALSSSLLPQALAALKSTLAPGGRLLLVARAREEADEIKGPPWPLPSSSRTFRRPQWARRGIGAPCSAAPKTGDTEQPAFIRAPEVARYHRFAVE